MEYIVKFPDAIMVAEGMPMKYTILYVDDDPIDRWLAEKELSSMDISVKVLLSSNPVNALGMIEEYYSIHSRLPDLIIGDLLMPMMNGFEFFVMVRELCFFQASMCELVLITEGLAEEDTKLIHELNIKHVLFKPLERSTIYKFI